MLKHSCIALGLLILSFYPEFSVGTVIQPEFELPTEDPLEDELHPMLAEVIGAGPFEPRWSSLIEHELPDWFKHDKLGISVHWGPYAVPGWTPHKDSPFGVAYAEWYRVWMESNPAVKKHHVDTYDGVHYDDFINGATNLSTGSVERFSASKFDADAWMKTFSEAGFRYFFITAKHHDGFCLWDTDYTDRNAVAMGPRRDLLRELVDAARVYGVRIGFYYSFYEWNNPYYTGQDLDAVRYDGLKELDDCDGDGIPSEYVDDFMIPQIKELIDLYHPDYLCFDGEWDHGYQHWRSRQIIAYYYNQAASRGQPVVVNDRFGQANEGNSDTRGVYGDFYHVEYEAEIDRTKPWAMWRGFGNSYGYNRNEPESNILSITDTIKLLVEVIGDNGNVEFNLGPRSDGSIAEFELERIEAIGRWLAVNGEAIFGATKAALPPNPVYRTTRQTELGRLYVHVFNWPLSGALKITDADPVAKHAYLLASGQNLRFEADEDGSLLLQLPQTPPDKHVSVIVVQY
jgi:alpha-L-fucosidase